MNTSPIPPLSPGLETLIVLAANRVRASRRTVALTGAGLSVESGIPPFRSAACGTVGLWERYDPMEYATIDAFERDPARVWMMLRELSATLHRARPNAGHEALARLEACGMLAGIITQNIDGLHQEAGSREVLELHGSWRTMACLRCRRRVESRGVPLESLPPLCACGGVLKPDVTLFGEIIPSPLIDAAWEQARSCDCLVVVGTSTEVAPASAIPMAASDCGAFIIEINIEPTPLSKMSKMSNLSNLSNLNNRVVDLSIQGPAGVILPRLAAAVGVWREN